MYYFLSGIIFLRIRHRLCEQCCNVRTVLYVQMRYCECSTSTNICVRTTTVYAFGGYGTYCSSTTVQNSTFACVCVQVQCVWWKQYCKCVRTTTVYVFGRYGTYCSSTTAQYVLVVCVCVLACSTVRTALAAFVRLQYVLLRCCRSCVFAYVLYGAVHAVETVLYVRTYRCSVCVWRIQYFTVSTYKARVLANVRKIIQTCTHKYYWLNWTGKMYVWLVLLQKNTVL